MIIEATLKTPARLFDKLSDLSGSAVNLFWVILL